MSFYYVGCIIACVAVIVDVVDNDIYARDDYDDDVGERLRTSAQLYQTTVSF